MNTLELVKSRRSTRSFQKKMIEKEKLSTVIEAGRYAPSGGNSQQCHFTVITKPDVLDVLAKMVQQIFSEMDYDENTYSSIVSSIRNSRNGNYIFHYGAPVLIIVSNIKGYGNAMADSACALENMMLMANELDLGSCWINQLHWLEENKELRTYLSQFGIQENETICGALAVGYADTADGKPIREHLKRKGNLVDWIE